MDYHKKYLKYKNKYLNILNQSQKGGMDKKELLKEYSQASPERKREIMDLLYSGNRDYYSDTSRQPENVGQMVGFLNSYEPGLISDNIAPNVYSNLLAEERNFDRMSNWVNNQEEKKPVDINDMAILNQFMSEGGVDLAGNYLMTRGWWGRNSYFSNLRRETMVLAIKLGLGANIDVLSGDLMVDLTNLIKAKLDNFNPIDYKSFGIFLKLGGVNMTGIELEKIKQLWDNKELRSLLLNFVKDVHGLRINLNEPDLLGSLQELKKELDLKYLKSLFFTNYRENSHHIMEFLKLGQVTGIDNYDLAVRDIVENWDPEKIEKLLTVVKFGLGNQINLSDPQLNLDAIIQAKLAEDAGKPNLPYMVILDKIFFY